jgi:hypothetical protein
MAMKNDSDLKRDVEDELKWEPRVNGAHIGVTVKEKAPDGLFWGVIAVCVVGLTWAVWQSKRESKHND